jgi:hypothetical protein
MHCFRCYTGTEKNGFYGPMNPTKKRVYAFLQVRDVQSDRLGLSVSVQSRANPDE